MRTERQAWLSSKAYQKMCTEAAEAAAKDTGHREVMDRVRSAIKRAQEVLAEEPEG